MRGCAERCCACCTGRRMRVSEYDGSSAAAGSGRARSATRSVGRAGSPAGAAAALAVAAAGADVIAGAEVGLAAVTAGLAGCALGCVAAGLAATVVFAAGAAVEAAGPDAMTPGLPEPSCQGVICAPASVAIVTWTSVALRQIL